MRSVWLSHRRRSALSQSLSASADLAIPSSRWMRNAFDIFVRALPVLCAYLPVSFAFGTICAQHSISLAAALLMSFWVYGSSQFILLELYFSGQPFLSIVFTILMMNARYILMSASLSPYLSHWPEWKRLVFSSKITDETFALYSTKLQQQEGLLPDNSFIFVHEFLHLSWFTGTLLGFATGSWIADVRPFGLDYANYGMLVALVALQLRNQTRVLIAVVSGGLAVAIACIGKSYGHILIGALVGSFVGVWWEERCRRK